MRSGQDTLASLDAAITQLHAQESDLDRAMQAAMAQAQQLAVERGKVLRALARIKLDEIASGRLASGLDAAERRAAELMAGRKDRLARLAAQRDAALHSLEASERVQAAAAAAVAKVLAEVEALRSQTEARLADEARAKAARVKLAEAERIATEAQGKAEQNAAELAAKKKPYDDDPLFQYLWGRGFGTSAYAHSGLVRVLDRMVARFIGYLEVRGNYHMLNEIPQRLKDHADAQNAMIEVYRGALVRLEREELDTAGMPVLERKLAAAREALAKADAELETERGALAEIDARRDRMIDGSGDPAMVEAIATMAAQDGRDDIATLQAEARRTATPEDERLVRQIETIDRELAGNERQLDDLRQRAVALAERRSTVEQTRGRFRRSGYDHPNATFGNDNAIADVLGGILTGALKGGILWDTLNGGYGHRPPSGRPDFGGGFPFPVPGGWNGDTGSGGSSAGTSGAGWREPQSSGPWAPSEPAGGSPDLGDMGGGTGGDTFTTGGRF